MGKILGKLLGEAAGTAIPGGKLYYKTLTKGINWVGKVISRKKDKAEARKKEAEARLAQLSSIDFQGLQNPGTATPETGAQAAVFGAPETATKPANKKGLGLAFELLTKNGKTTNQQTQSTMMNTEWLKRNWLYVAGGAAVLYFLMKGKKR
jgi:hypothetical protein